MSDLVISSGTDESKQLAAILERLERLETLVHNDRLEKLEGNEGIEGPPEEVLAESILEEEVDLAAAHPPVTNLQPG